MRVSVKRMLFVLAIVLGPSFAFAQASIRGVVKDSSGAVLPGVTVEASSPALIEKTRSAVTDGAGQYAIEDLRPGTYAVSYSLSGFTTIRREGVELTGTFVATLNVDLKVGNVAETITVSGETPVVDVVSAKQQATVSNDTIAAIPTARLYHSIAALIPGVSVSGTQDVGGIAGPTTVTFSMRGGPGNEGRLTVDGMSLGASLNGTGVSYTVADVGNAQEIVFTTAAALGESEVGGPSMNLVPRQGGNRFTGTFFANGANDSLASSNYSDALKAQGLPAPSLLLKIWDTNGAVGGPVRKDRLWFFSAARYQGNRKTAPNFVNANADDPSKWTYVALRRKAPTTERGRASTRDSLSRHRHETSSTSSGTNSGSARVHQQQSVGDRRTGGALQQPRIARAYSKSRGRRRSQRSCSSRPDGARTSLTDTARERTSRTTTS